MSYKDKVLKKRLFTQSLSTLRDFAFLEPKLSLKNRQEIISSIVLGGTLSANYQSFKIHPAYSLSYQYTRQGLIRACSDKMVTSSIEENQRLRKAICVLSSLSNWAQNNKNLSGDIFDNFIQEIVPENHTMEIQNPSSSVLQDLKKESGTDFPLDLVTLSGRLFYKKYKGK